MEEKEKYIMCNHCKRLIKDKDDLVVAFDFFAMNPYHSECFAQRSKNNFFMNGNPVNGTVSNAVTVFFGLAGLLVSFTDYYILTIVSIVHLSTRLYSYFKYEKILEE
ncbi:MAG: hypothetical protein N2448_01295 [Caloramator sp.]|nr:hypothetical protein [Caloramator sp.]